MAPITFPDREYLAKFPLNLHILHRVAKLVYAILIILSIPCWTKALKTKKKEDFNPNLKGTQESNGDLVRKFISKY